MRVKLTLRPLKNRMTMPVNYNYFLTSLIYTFLKNSSEDFSGFLHDTGYMLPESKKGFKLFTYSMLKGDNVIVKGDSISFGKGSIYWEVSSPVNDFIQHLVTGVFSEGQEIRIGSSGHVKDGSSRSSGLNGLSGSNSLNRLLIEQVETLPKPIFKTKMKFFCLSPVTVSKVVGLSGSNGLNGLIGSNGLSCHYLRPWEDGFSEAIRNNLVKKYRLANGKELEAPELSIKIDMDYMNKKAGKIIKKINFKGTNIIGFMAPFEVTGSPELLEIGYEAGFGEKGSMGFGMVKIIA